MDYGTMPHAGRLHGTLYRPETEHDACGAGFVADVHGRRTREVVELALGAVERLAHRGAVDPDGGTGDGAGLLIQVPHEFLAREVPQAADWCGEPGQLGVGMVFLPRRSAATTETGRRLVAAGLNTCGLAPLAWRDVPVDDATLGPAARATRPHVAQVLVARPDGMDEAAFERQLYRARRWVEQRVRRGAGGAQGSGVYVASLSCRTVAYKGLFVGHQLRAFYPDLGSELLRSAIATFHQRYSTNTFPTWERAQPLRMLCHNGEVNTLDGNVNWMRARQGDLGSDAFGVAGDDLAWAVPVVDRSGSDSGMLDNVLELLVLGGRDIRHALAMLVPPAWEGRGAEDDAQLRDFFRYHQGVMEPWDGPAALGATDGRWACAALDRNGLRPLRWLATHDGLVACASEVGAIPVTPERVAHRGKLGPGEMLAVDTMDGRICHGEEIVRELAALAPWGEWADAREVVVPAAAEPSCTRLDADTLARTQAAFGYTREELNVVVRPMLVSGAEPVGSMGDDTPVPPLATRERPLYSYLRQRFAEVTNPPIDPIRERSAMSLAVLVGARPNLLDQGAAGTPLLRLARPVVCDGELVSLIETAGECDIGVATVTTTFDEPAPGGGPADEDVVPETWGVLDAALDRLCAEAEQAVAGGAGVLVLSDRGAGPGQVAMPALAALGAVHHHLIRRGMRMRCSLVVDSGEPREVHHVAALIGFGANVVCPWLLLASVGAIAGEARRQVEDVDEAAALRNTVGALATGVLKVMSKMGISSVDSYCGAQVFEAMGLAPTLVARCFDGTPNIEGRVDLDELAERSVARHLAAWGPAAAEVPALQSPGLYKYSRSGEQHAFSPPLVKALQKAVATPDVLGDGFDAGYAQYLEYVAATRGAEPTQLRDLVRLVSEVAADGRAIGIGEVEPVSSIVRRFSTGAMSHGALSAEAHETLAIALNRLGALSNCGEGGEDPSRFGTDAATSIKQVASARFGVTPAYLQAARELQIKMAQGSKPGEGGQLPGFKVTDEIARLRHTEPGVPLISPPPHHDIYSIEDLAQLIYDLRQANPDAAVTVKLVSQSGVGTIAAGVAKALADGILISGSAGGTGASPLSSIKGAGMPWELGLAESQQVLVANDLRGRVFLRADGGLRTGRDVVVAALLGADEFSFGTAALVAQGCLMARTCHNDQCPVGIASQRPELRAKFPGTPERVMAYLLFVAEEVRSILAALGVSRIADIVGRTDLLLELPPGSDGRRPAELARMLAAPEAPATMPRSFRPDSWRNSQSRSLGDELADRVWPRLTDLAAAGDLPAPGAPREDADRVATTIPNLVIPDVTTAARVRVTLPITNVDRSVGARLAGRIARQWGDDALPPRTVEAMFDGYAGQSFGAFVGRGQRLVLTGEANDYVAKGLAGGEVIVRGWRLDPTAAAAAADDADHAWLDGVADEPEVIAGNTLLYGATGGVLLCAGRAGERFAVRNSGATAVVEGVGDHGCEYMTGGVVVVLGPTGHNFAAGMTGGQAFVYDRAGTLAARTNTATVTVGVPSAGELDDLRELLLAHARLTGSCRAARVLANWPVTRDRFRTVVPIRDVAAEVVPSEDAEAAGDTSLPAR